MSTKKNGFSLIELSIVLVIISLLIAGITGGSSLIKSSELRSIIAEIRNYQTVLNAYYTATGELPASNTSLKMDFKNSCNAWAALSNEGVFDAELNSFNTDEENKYFCPTTISKFSLDNSSPSKIKGSFFALGYNNQMAENVIFIISGINTTPEMLINANNQVGKVSTVKDPSISKRDAKFLDEKMDNGIIDSGKIYSFSTGSNNTPNCTYNNSSKIDCSIAISFGL